MTTTTSGGGGARRDKRRHLSSSLEIQDPREVIALAVRFDESCQDENLLSTPLEDGSLYSSAEFNKALLFLQKKTAPPRRITHKKATMNFALAPIILSGLLGTLSDDGPSSSELVLYCQAMRAAALQRLRAQKKRRKIRKIAVPLGALVCLFLFYVQGLYKLRTSLVQLGYVGSCYNINTDYEDACRLAEAELWGIFQDYALKPIPTCTLESCDASLTENIQEDGPYAVQTKLEKDPIQPHEIQGRPKDPNRRLDPVSGTSNLVLMGRTIINLTITTYIRQRIQKLNGAVPYILDVGCGAGAFLYALQEENFFREYGFVYHGMSISAAEAHHARLLADHHDLRRAGEDDRTIRFHQRNFDDPLPANKYMAVIAIESLSFSRDLQVTLNNLCRSLAPGTLMMIVDDVIYQDRGDEEKQKRIERLARVSSRHSLWTHDEWVSALDKAGCPVVTAKDLGFAYDDPWVMYHEGWEKLTYWWQLPARRFLERFNHWLEGSRWFRADSIRIFQLFRDRLRLARGRALRRKSHANADLAIYMYVCRKEQRV